MIRSGGTAPGPRVAFVGLGWIGVHRLRAFVKSGIGSVAGLVDVDAEALARAAGEAPDAPQHRSLEALLEDDLDGVVLATPSALHAEQAEAALAAGLPVFCQKPLARSAAEARRVASCARRADRLLAVDWSYRHVAGVAPLRELLRSGSLGRLYAVDLVFHNAYGPDAAWFRDRRLSGGGCLMDLGSHLLDLAFWLLDRPCWSLASCALYAKGRALRRGDPAEVEDCALADFRLADDAALRLACSWNLSAGRDAVIEASFYGTRGGAALRNVAGSFYDFTVERFEGTHSARLAGPPDAWGGRALCAWVRQLARDPRFDPTVETSVDVAAALDEVYACACRR